MHSTSDGLARLHLAVGVLMLLLFLGSGQYMRHVLEVSAMSDVPRLMHRSAHLYLFFTAVANVALGLYAAPGALRGWWVGVCSTLLVLAPFMMAGSFLLESTLPTVERPLAFYGALATFFGISGHLAGAAWRRFARGSGER